MKITTGKILHVDLSSEKIWEEPLSKKFAMKYLGSRGINAKLLWDFVTPDTDPLGSENVLIFGAGSLTGTAAPCSGRTTITFLSPATGLYAKSNVGGSWGAELKYAGYSHIVIRGKAIKPVYIWIENDNIEIRDASKLWGMDVRKLDKELKLELDNQEISIASIGQAGENLVKYASVMVDVYNAAGRCGVGTVMGSKNLKAIAVRGNGQLEPAKPEIYNNIVKEARESLSNDSGTAGLRKFGTAGSFSLVNELRVFSFYNFQRSCGDDIYSLTGEYLVDKGYLKRRVACYSCIIGCHRFCSVERGTFAGSFGGGPELETLGAFGAGCGIFDMEAVIKANELCNIYGLDTISAGSAIQWAMESYEKGVIGKDILKEIDLSWGNSESTLQLIEKIAHREGIGDILADGVKAASEYVGGDSYKWAVQAKGLEQSRVDTRSAKAYSLAFAVNPRGPDHLHTETFAEFGASPESRALIKKITGDEKYAKPDCTDKRAEIVRWHEDCFTVSDCLGICCFTTTALYGITPKLMAELFSAYLGYDFSEEEILHAGKRILTLEKCFNIRMGATRKDDILPWRLMNEPSPDIEGSEAVNSKEELDQMLDEYYTLHGWDLKNSWPTRGVLESLGLSDIADELDKLEKLGGL